MEYRKKTVIVKRHDFLAVSRRALWIKSCKIRHKSLHWPDYLGKHILQVMTGIVCNLSCLRRLERIRNAAALVGIRELVCRPFDATTRTLRISSRGKQPAQHTVKRIIFEH